MKVLFISSMAIVAPDPAESRKLFIDALGLPLKRHEGDDYYFSESIGGSKHFGVWPLSQAAEACFGTREWPVDRPETLRTRLRSSAAQFSDCSRRDSHESLECPAE